MSTKRKFFDAFQQSVRQSPLSTKPESEEESTDFKLAVLSSLHPELSSTTLLELLLTCDGSIDAASALANTNASTSPRKTNATSCHLNVNQSSLTEHLAANAVGSSSE